MMMMMMTMVCNDDGGDDDDDADDVHGCNLERFSNGNNQMAYRTKNTLPCFDLGNHG
jgi:hypothetical protein